MKTIQDFEAEVAHYDKLSEKFDVSSPVIKLAKQILEELKSAKAGSGATDVRQ